MMKNDNSLKYKFLKWNYKYRKVIGTLFLSVFAMFFMSYGTFNPTKVGFWLCLAFAISTGVVSIFHGLWHTGHFRAMSCVPQAMDWVG